MKLKIKKNQNQLSNNYSWDLNNNIKNNLKNKNIMRFE